MCDCFRSISTTYSDRVWYWRSVSLVDRWKISSKFKVPRKMYSYVRELETDLFNTVKNRHKCRKQTLNFRQDIHFAHNKSYEITLHFSCCYFLFIYSSAAASSVGASSSTASTCFSWSTVAWKVAVKATDVPTLYPLAISLMSSCTSTEPSDPESDLSP